MPTQSKMPFCLGTAAKGFSGFVMAISLIDTASGLSPLETELRLIELGFIEGARVTILQEGPVGRDPIAVRVNGATVALRRREAMAILVAQDQTKDHAVV